MILKFDVTFATLKVHQKLLVMRSMPDLTVSPEELDRFVNNVLNANA